MGKVAYVHVEADGAFMFHNADGSANTISGEPVFVDGEHVAYLDTVPWVERTGDVLDELTYVLDSNDGGEEQ